MRVTYESFCSYVNKYNKDALEKVKRAYGYAYKMHEGQYRKSGEPYIIHPLNVAYILAEMDADADTLCAGLLHDVLEDTNTTKEELINLFGEDVATLVEGVTNITDLNFSSKQEQRFANERKIINSLTTDVRIIVIKLADRLHNMRTLKFMSEEKQKEKSLETLEVFASLAYELGISQIKRELEDLALMYLDKKKYKEIEKNRDQIIKESKYAIDEMVNNITNALKEKEIKFEIITRIMGVYSIYRRTLEGQSITSIHDLLSIRIIVKDIDDCYKALGVVHSRYLPINEKFKDYICRPKSNMYQALHTTVFATYGDWLVKFLIRTEDMEKVAMNGLPSYWNLYKGEARIRMQKDLQERYEFMKSLSEISGEFNDNQNFLVEVKRKILTDNKVFVYTTRGAVVELPPNATVLDFAYKIHTELGDNMTGAIVNGKYVTSDYKLYNGDRITILTK